MWDATKCNLCGDCLVNCRYVDYDGDKAIAEVRLLMEGKDAEILSKCTTCMACMDYCPTGADPSDLIFQLQEKIGTSPIVAVGKPVLQELAHALEGHGEHRQVIPGDPDKPVLSFDSFRFEQFPEGTLDSQLFKGMTVVRGYDYANLAGNVHMGGESFVKKYGQRVLSNLASLGKEIVFIHNEGFVLPGVKAKEYGFKVNFKYMHLFEYLRNYVRDHKDNVTSLNKKVAYQANCATRWMHEYDAFLDEIFELVGVERPPRQYDGVDALCCSAPLIYVNRELAVDIQKKNFEDAISVGADAMITSCPICYGVFRRPSLQYKLPSIFITDLCRIALGERPWPNCAR
ncbi:MAG: (Fe-S)-binding protein [Dehalococcoidia bacterium]|nr:(Fe-S)-binding protein [Dehalococcoidia bacterium]MDH4299883.1 (Fe-S)-binding protein [Dehalococcoidia bacterium]MDH4366632.1 (Fe-S)-binding protein [Dehalococcoidia bacterium]